MKISSIFTGRGRKSLYLPKIASSNEAINEICEMMIRMNDYYAVETKYINLEVESES